MPGLVSAMIGLPRSGEAKPWILNVQLRPLHGYLGLVLESVLCDSSVRGEWFKAQPVRGGLRVFSGVVVSSSSKCGRRLNVPATLSFSLSAIGPYSLGFSDATSSEMEEQPLGCFSHSSYLAFRILGDRGAANIMAARKAKTRRE